VLLVEVARWGRPNPIGGFKMAKKALKKGKKLSGAKTLGTWGNKI
jgi:hypothetical protein